LRGLGRINIFPGDDVGARKNLERWLKLVKPLDYVSVHCILKRWHPYGGLVLLPPVVGQVGGGRIPDGRNIASIERWLSTKRNKEYIGEHIDETRIQIWGSCRVELGSRTCSRNDKKEGHHHYQV